MLTVTTTHIKRGWIRANGVPQSDAATVTEHLIRHGDTITILAIVNDPVYLSEPLTKTSLLFRQTVAPDAWLYACDDSEQILGRKNDDVPSHLFGQNPFVREYADKNKVPLLGAMGGAETMYPEFLTKVRDAAAAETAAKAKMLPAGPGQASRAPDPSPNDGNIHVFHVAGSVYMLAGDGANIAVQVGPQGSLVVDTGAGKLSDKVIAEIGKLSSKPIQFTSIPAFVLNTPAAMRNFRRPAPIPVAQNCFKRPKVVPWISGSKGVVEYIGCRCRQKVLCHDTNGINTVYAVPIGVGTEWRWLAIACGAPGSGAALMAKIRGRYLVSR